jgi:2-polyprenyl-3-methyl-5-hydroxy-6-metoxy-1,4-benzoquinol methylase
MIEEGDRLLDIGCGDGFFTKRFFSTKCSQIDAIDVDQEAIQIAIRYNTAPNIQYHRMDAVQRSFPGKSYHVIVWDGAIGHFSHEDTKTILGKICHVLTPDGVFVGSESLGREEGGYDHLQFFSLDDLYRLFKPYFQFIQMRTVNYKVGWTGNLNRREAYWRCSNSSVRLSAGGWHSCS